MRKIMTACTAAFLAMVIVDTWAQGQTAAQAPTERPAAINPFDLMVNAKDLPVHEIVDAV